MWLSQEHIEVRCFSSMSTPSVQSPHTPPDCFWGEYLMCSGLCWTPCYVSVLCLGNICLFGSVCVYVLSRFISWTNTFYMYFIDFSKPWNIYRVTWQCTNCARNMYLWFRRILHAILICCSPMLFYGVDSSDCVVTCIRKRHNIKLSMGSDVITQS